jgi:hypothetical protein
VKPFPRARWCRPFVFQGVGVGNDGHAEEQRQPEIDIVAENMEKRQVGQHDVVAGHGQDLGDIHHIRPDVAVGELNRLGVLFTARGEQDNQVIVWLSLVDRFQQETERQLGFQKPLHLVGGTDVFHDILDKDHARNQAAADLFQQRPGSDNGLEAALFLRVFGIAGRTGGIIDHDRDFAGQQHAEDRKHAAGRSGDHDADEAVMIFFKFVGQDQRSDQGLGIGDLFFSGAIDDGQFFRILFGVFNEFLVQEHVPPPDNYFLTVRYSTKSFIYHPHDFTGKSDDFLTDFT